MQQYPDSIVVTVIAAPTEVSGVYTAGASGNYTMPCRVEANTAGRKIHGPDGSEMDYAFQVFLPAMATLIPGGSPYVVTSSRNGTIQGKVKLSFNGQLSSRLWL
jgi:hypothetical protein